MMALPVKFYKAAFIWVIFCTIMEQIFDIFGMVHIFYPFIMLNALGFLGYGIYYIFSHGGNDENKNIK